MHYVKYLRGAYVGGTFGTLLYTGHDWVDSTLARRLMELMANEVWPRVLEAPSSRSG